ncbi:MAG: aminoacyl-histidine dipeptidase [Lachnospiraceae bacterium]|nr:aminoacyl-histidine dipeptidase [Lachnospiraceae bacterium]
MLENLNPKKVFQYFEEICSIPHGSGNVDAISDYLVEFAKEHGLWWKQDELKNVIMIKEASPGKEDRPAVMIQGHMDMVAVKEPDADIDMTKDGLRLSIDGDYVYAKDTSLGGDDGIALAYGLALLSDESISHPRMELVITTEEEVGMEGATGIDLSPCQGMQMLNIDSEEEGQFVAACAGGIRVNGRIPVERVQIEESSGKEERENEEWANEERGYKECLRKKIMLTGFAGGHSGTEIGRNGGNANIVLGWFLNELSKRVDITIYEMQGGLKDNAIPVEAYAVIGNGTDSKEALGTDGKENMGERRKLWEKKFADCCDRLQKEMQSRFLATDPECRVVVTDCAKDENAFLSGLRTDDSKKILAFLAEAPNGVQAMCEEPEGLVQTSLNLGIMKLEEKGLQTAFSLRSSVAKEKEELKERVCSLIEKYNGLVTTTGDYPAWEYKKESPLREKMIAVYEKQYGKKPLVLSLHAGLECGILAAKKPGLDCVSFGPDILDIHTTRERMSISSVERVWEFLVEVVEEL